jgi:hypothetical protein
MYRTIKDRLRDGLASIQSSFDEGTFSPVASLRLGILVLFALALTFPAGPVDAEEARFQGVSATLSRNKPATLVNLRVKMALGQAYDTGGETDTTNGDSDIYIGVLFPTVAGSADPFTFVNGITGTDVDWNNDALSAATITNFTTMDSDEDGVFDMVILYFDMTSAGSAIVLAQNTSLTLDFLNNQILTPTKVSPAGTADIYGISVLSYINDTEAVIDAGAAGITINDATTITASVNTTVYLEVTAFPASSTLNGESTSASGTASPTATTIPFGTLVPNTAVYAGQRLNIETNAPNGYSVYLVQNQTLQNNAGNLIDGFNDGDGSYYGNGSPNGWTVPIGDVQTSSSYGHIGYTTDDATLDNSGDGVDRFTSGGPKFASIPTLSGSGVAPRTEGIVAFNAASTTSDIIGVGFKIEISGLQEKGSYTNEIYYVLTPLY